MSRPDEERVVLSALAKITTHGPGGPEQGISSAHLVSLNLAFVRSHVADHPDGSVEDRVVVSSAGGTLDGEPLTLDLAGRAIALRHFLDGEILQVGGLEHWGGPGRWLDVFEPCWVLLSPFPPDALEASQTAHRSLRWPLVPSGEGRAELDWKQVDATRHEASLSYAGPWSSKVAGADLAVRGRGTAAGEVRFVDGEWTQQTFAWTREVKLLRSGWQQSHGEYQTQEFTGTLQRTLGSLPLQLQPATVYLNAEAVADGMQETLTAADACVSSLEPAVSDGTWPVTVDIRSDGSSILSNGGEGDPRVVDCVTNVLVPRKAWVHDEAVVRARYTLVVQRGHLIPYPNTVLEQRELLAPLMWPESPTQGGAR